MAIGFNMKTLNISEPESLYESLNQMIRFDEFEAVTSSETEEGFVYYLGGLNYHNLAEAGLEEETLGRLRSALDSDNVLYAIFPEDRRNGYLPLVLNQNTRVYLEKNIPELFTNDYVDWFLYKLPGDIDVDDNQRSGSKLVIDPKSGRKEEPIVVEYGEIASKLQELAGIYAKEDNLSDVFDSDVVTMNTEQMDEYEKKKEEELAESDDLNLGLTDEDVADKAFQPEDEEDTTEEVIEDTDFDSEFDKILESDETPSPSAVTDNEMDEAENIELPDGDTLDISDDTQAIADESNKATDEYLGLPDSLLQVLDTIKLHRFKPYRTTNVHPRTKEVMDKIVADSNESIHQIESDIKRKLISMYQSHMAESMKHTKAALDSITGSDTVVNYHKEIEAGKSQAHEEAMKLIEDKQKELEDSFYGEQFENFKNEWLAQAKQLFTEQYYGDRVGVPLDEFKEDTTKSAEEKQYALQADYDDWLMAVEENAKATDQARIVELVSKEMTQLVDASKAEIRDIQMSIEQQHRDLISAEALEASRERDESYIERLFTERYKQTDESKAYQAERDRLAEENAHKDSQLIAANETTERLKKDLDKKFSEANELYQSKLAEIEENYKNQPAAVETVEATGDTGKKKWVNALKYPLAGLAGAALLVTGLMFGSDEQEPQDAAPFSSTALESGEYSEGDIFSSEINGVERSFEVETVNENSLQVRDMLTNEISYVPISSDSNDTE